MVFSRSIVRRGTALALGCVLLLLAAACGDTGGGDAEPPAMSRWTATAGGDLAQLTCWLTGSFSSRAQSEADSAFYDIRLEMHRIWPERQDGNWLYVEQAVADQRDRPYRQRVYHLTPLDDGAFESAVFTLPDPARFVCAGKLSGPALGSLTPDSLTIRQGCAIVLRRVDEASFAGSTQDQDCGSSLRGASYATSEVIVRVDRLISWDRGFDAEGVQVWGAEKGGYVFDRVGEAP